MNEQIFEIIDSMRAIRIPEILAVIGGLLVLVDYYYPTDWPAHVGYVSFAAATFFFPYMYGAALVWCVVTAVAVWLLLAILHRVLLRQYLENAPGTPGYEGAAGESSPGEPATDA